MLPDFVSRGPVILFLYLAVYKTPVFILCIVLMHVMKLQYYCSFRVLHLLNHNNCISWMQRAAEELDSF